jgi:hypothetical protein
MIRSFLFIVVLLTNINTTYGQSLPSSQSERVDYTKHQLNERLSFFPFNKASKIAIASFVAMVDSSKGRRQLRWGLPTINDTISLSRLEQIKLLNASEVANLTDIMYNTCFRATIIEKTSMGCYFPRNAILFLDSVSRAFAYIEICFECYGIKNSSGINQINECDIMYQDLEAYFKTLGLKTSASELIKKYNSR